MICMPFDPSQTPTPTSPIAYFCMEFALKHDFHIYSGGLGILAGDFLLEAEREHLPVIGIGLLYSSIFHQRLDDEGRIFDEIAPTTAEDLGFSLVTDVQGNRVLLSIPLKDKQIYIQAWKKNLNAEVTFILLDTKIPDNPPEFQMITDKLYFGDKDHRFQQEIVLGIGGMKLLSALHINPYVVHMNEGHAALCGIEMIAQFMNSESCSFEDAFSKTREKLVFSNHTLIAAGNDTFSKQMVSDFLGSYTRENTVHIDEVTKLGAIPNTDQFSMTFLGMRTAKKTNAVSHFHAEKAKEIWPDFKLLPITNGVFLPRWYAREKAAVWGIDQESPENPLSFWHAHQETKEHLLHFVRKKTGKSFPSNGLVLTWARRFVQYKRPEALFWSLDWLEKILKDSPVPVTLLFSGRGHPHDQEARRMVEHIVQISQSPRFSKYIAYIPDYNLEIAEFLVQGSDVWLNTPEEGFEACGTSGMKAGLNGVLQCSTNDGWVREVDWNGAGWILDNDHISESLYQTIQEKIIPLYCNRNHEAIPREWLNHMIKTSSIIRTQYSAQRMLKEYQEKLYR